MLSVVLILFASSSDALSSVCRRGFLAAGCGGTLLREDQAASLKSAALATMSPYGAPGTNLSLPLQVARDIERRAVELEGRVPASFSVDGQWRLLYSNAPEISTLSSLPLGFALGPVYQPISASRRVFENQAFVYNKFDLANASVRVVGEFRPLNETRFAVNFRRVVFQVDRKPFSFTKVLSPTVNPRAAIQITYIDPSLRITRGADGSLFVLVREEEVGRPLLLDDEERSALYEETLDADRVISGTGLKNWFSQSLLKKDVIE